MKNAETYYNECNIFGLSTQQICNLIKLLKLVQKETIEEINENIEINIEEILKNSYTNPRDIIIKSGFRPSSNHPTFKYWYDKNKKEILNKLKWK